MAREKDVVGQGEKESAVGARGGAAGVEEGEADELVVTERKPDLSYRTDEQFTCVSVCPPLC